MMVSQLQVWPEANLLCFSCVFPGKNRLAFHKRLSDFQALLPDTQAATGYRRFLLFLIAFVGIDYE